MAAAPTVPTARDYLTRFMFPAMEARARGMEQTRAIWNPSPEHDSLLEYLAEVRDVIPVEVMSKMLTLLRELLESNAAEGEHERAIARMADQMSRTARSFETNGHRGSRA